MKTTCATLLSLLLMLAQVLFFPAQAKVVVTGAVAEIAADSCCSAPRAHRCSCCVEESAGQPAPVAAVPAPGANDSLAGPPLPALPLALWSLPPPSPGTSAGATEAAAFAPPAVPLFLRHGALLI
jgi:hypothetical protein